jgi:hypothetical protein
MSKEGSNFAITEGVPEMKSPFAPATGNVTLDEHSAYWGITLDDLRKWQLKGREFYQLLQESIDPHRRKSWMMIIEPCGDNWTEERALKFAGQLGAVEYQCAEIYSKWVATSIGHVIRRGDAYYDNLNLTIRKLYDEQKHGRLYFDAVLANGWVKNRRELYLHPYFQILPGWQMFTQWLAYTGNFHPVAMHAGDGGASEVGAGPALHDIGKSMEAFNPELSGAFISQKYEEISHMKMAQYVIEKYSGNQPELQFLSLWTSYHNLMALRCAAEDMLVYMRSNVSPSEFWRPNVDGDEQPSSASIVDKIRQKKETLKGQ